VKPIRERNPAVVGLVGLIVLIVVALLTYFSDDLPFIGGGTSYTAYFTEAADLQPGNEVRIAGVGVGQVTGVSLDGAKVAVTFRVKDAWVGSTSTVAIKLWSLLGGKYLAVDPSGPVAQDPGTPIPVSRTTSPFDVTQALTSVGQQLSQINTVQLEKSIQTLSTAFAGTAPSVRQALTGLARLSQAIGSKDTELTSLLHSASVVSKTLAAQSATFSSLIKDGNLLLAELQSREDAVHALLVGTEALATQLSGLVADDQNSLGPTLTSLNQVTSLLERNQADLRQALSLVGPYYRLLTNSLGNGRWFDTYVCGLVPSSYLPPGTAPKRGCESPTTAGAPAK
jgi:phospholipid/cholesterol/gamma-HCH transport system substrate-binding protein